MGRIGLTVILALMILATAVADLGFMHAGNPAWPPHARLHAIWNVMHVTATHGAALALLWAPSQLTMRWRIRIAGGVLIAFTIGFFAATALSALFGASAHPDLPPEDMPPTFLGLDGNTLGFLAVIPFVVWFWRRGEAESSS